MQQDVLSKNKHVGQPVKCSAVYARGIAKNHTAANERADGGDAKYKQAEVSDQTRGASA